MPDPSFVHLRLHSEYSIADGIVRLEGAVESACRDRMPALALTDLGNLFGMVKFYQAARANGIKPIIGCDLWVANESNRDQSSRILLLCQSRAGYLRLCDLISRAYRSNQHRGRAEICKSWLAEGNAGLIALSGADLGDIGQALLQGNQELARKLAHEWQELFPGRFYLELQRSGLPQAESCVQQTMELAADLQLPVVATHPVQFLGPADFKAHEARVCIAEGYVLGDRRRPRNFTEQQYFKSQAEMAELFADIPEALANSVEIAKRCNFSLELGKSRLPQFPTPENVSLEQYLGEQAAGGLKARMEMLYPDPAKRAEQLPRYQQRLEFETETIIKMGFAGYFLIVADFINWAKQNSVPVGPGRGSGAGSLMAYCLGITDLDPLRYDLLFERFLNPERVSMPDFDIDFCQDGRERVIEYVRQKYGADSVSQIATFGTMAARAAVRDVGRVLDLPYNFVDQLAKLIPFELGMTLAKARAAEPLLNERVGKEEEVKELLELAERLEGVTRNVGMHAGGVLIAPGKLTDFCPVYCAQNSASVVSQLDKDDVELIGLVKFDFLGLRTLTILDWAVKQVRDEELKAGNNDNPAFFSLENIPLDDKATYALLKRANTVGVFQLESRGMRDLLQRVKPDCFEDIIALVALYRPGPMDLIPDFIRRKHGQEQVEYPDPRLEPILGPTYGIMVYQEQVMQIAQQIGGYSLGAADLLRRAMGKKKPEEMAQHRGMFVQGARERGVPQRKAEHLFDLMEKFAGYGFNKSHAAAYALVAYQTAYLKAHYPAAFMAATLSSEMDNTDKVQVFHADCLQHGLEILPPDANLSEYRFVPVGERQIRYGLGAIRGTGESAISAIVAVRRQAGRFTDLFDFCRRVDKRIVNRRVIESLIRAGAFDAVTTHRASLLATVGAAMDAAEQHSKSVNQSSLFEADAEATPHSLVEVPVWPQNELLLNEKLSVGFYLSGHPFSAYRKEVAAFVKVGLGEISVPETARAPQPMLLAGIIKGIRITQTRRGRMGFATLDDGAGEVEVAVFGELLDAHRDWLKEDQLLIVEGRVSRDEYSGGLRVVAERLFDLAAARTHFARAMRLSCNGVADARRLMDILGPYRSKGCPVVIDYRNGGASCKVELGEAWRVQLHDNLLRSLVAWLREENVTIMYQ